MPFTGAAGSLGESSWAPDLVTVTHNVSRVRFQMRGEQVDVRCELALGTSFPARIATAPTPAAAIPGDYRFDLHSISKEAWAAWPSIWNVSICKSH